MKKTPARILSLLLLLSLSIGYLSYAHFDIMQLACKVAAGIDQSDSRTLVTLKVPLKEFTDENKKDEIWINGGLYDVHSYVIINDTALVSVHQDKEEEHLISAIVSVFQTNDQYTGNDGYNHFNKYKPFLPDGKVLTKLFQLTVSKYYVGNSFAIGTPFFIADYRSTAVIKPPPDNIIVTTLS